MAAVVGGSGAEKSSTPSRVSIISHGIRAVSVRLTKLASTSGTLPVEGSMIDAGMIPTKVVCSARSLRSEGVLNAARAASGVASGSSTIATIGLPKGLGLGPLAVWPLCSACLDHSAE